MPFAKNPQDGTRVYFEDDGGDGAPVVLHGGIVDSVDLVRDSEIARALHPDEFRLIYVDHRGLGRSDKPHQLKAYATPLRVADVVAVLEELGIERAHFVGTSYGGRLGFGIGEHAPERVLSLVIGGQQPFAMNPDTPLARMVSDTLAASEEAGNLEAFVRGLEKLSGIQLPAWQRAAYLDNDPVAVHAASSAMLAEDDISADLGAWRVRCLIFVGAGDVDFYDHARRAAQEIPNAEFVSLDEADHMRAHLHHDVVLPAVLRTLRGVRDL